MLDNITIAINSMGLIAALWLGLYLVTRNSDRPEAWLSALGLWSLGGYFLNHLLSLLPPPAPAPEVRAWLYHIILFWPRNVFEMGWKGWLLGWLPAYSIMFWYHVTLLILPGKFTRYRMLGAVAGYAAALAGILLNSRYYNTWVSLFDDPLYNPPMVFTIFPLYAIVFVLFGGLIFYNLLRAARSSSASMRSGQFSLFFGTLLLVGANSLMGVVSTLTNTSIPQVITAFVYLAAILLAGIAIIGYIASPGVRSLWRDLLYYAIWAAVILGISLLVLWIITKANPLSTILSVLVASLAVISSFVINVARLKLNREYSSNDGDSLLIQIPKQNKPIESNENREILVSDEQRSSGQLFEQPDKTRELSARSVELALRSVHDYAYLADSPLSSLHLVTLRLKTLGEEESTYIDRGRVVSDILCEAVRMLKPSQDDMPNPPPRTWYPYIILWDAYIDNTPNLVIMSRLYISEGTFNRTRKAAISSVARLLLEMEAHAK